MWIVLAVSMSLTGGLYGCAAAAVGAAGTAGGIIYTDRGAKGEIKGDVPKAHEQALAALKKMNIQVTGSEMKESGKERTLEAKSGGTDISVKMTQATAQTTQVEVIARESTFKWNKDYAKEVLAKIVNQG